MTAAHLKALLKRIRAKAPPAVDVKGWLELGGTTAHFAFRNGQTTSKIAVAETALRGGAAAGARHVLERLRLEYSAIGKVKF